MAFTSYEELMATVEERRKDTLTLEVDMGSTYSQEYEDAKKELAQAKALKQLAGNQEFLGDNVAALEQRVAEAKPEVQAIWIRYNRLSLGEFALLTKQTGLSAIDQYEKVLQKVFVGVYGEDPSEVDEDGELVRPDLEPLTTDARAVSSRENEGSILPGGLLHSVVQNFITWQNSSGEITIRPTKSGRA